MSERTKHENFVSEETLEQIGNLIESLSNHLGTSMTLFDANGNVSCESANPSSCSLVTEDNGSKGSVCQECHERLLARLKTNADKSIVEECSNGVEIVAVPVKTQKQFMGMLCFNPTGTERAEEQTHSTIAFLENLVQQAAMRSQALGAMASQLLESHVELTTSHQSIETTTNGMDMDSLLQEVLELVQNHVKPKESRFVIPSKVKGFEEIAHSGIAGSDTGLFNINIYSRIVEKVLQGTPVLINSNNERPNSNNLDISVRSMLAMPVRVGKDVFGAIILAGKENGEMFLACDEKFVESSTKLLGAALERIKLTEKVASAEMSSIEKQRELVARVVHKMRNLLMAMQGNVKWIHEIFAAEEINREDLESALEGVDRNFRRSSEMVTDFLKYVSPDQLQPECVDISSIISEVAENMRKSYKDVLIEEEHYRGLPQTWVDVDIFVSVIEELIGNAIQSLNGDGCISLRTGLASNEELKMAGVPMNGQYVAIEVSDNGSGISDDIKSKIFDPGFSTRPMGTGLGLSLVKREIELHGGSIAEIGKAGADFLIVLPISDKAQERNV